MPNHIEIPKLPKDKEIASQIISNNSALNRAVIEQGYLGKFWGSPKSIPNNIAGLTVILLLITGVIYTFFALHYPSSSLTIQGFWSIITPLITLAIGYLFGGKTKDS